MGNSIQKLFFRMQASELNRAGVRLLFTNNRLTNAPSKGEDFGW